jgi:hypothetical protein
MFRYRMRSERLAVVLFPSRCYHGQDNTRVLQTGKSTIDDANSNTILD